MRQSRALLEALKAALRAKGLRLTDVASELRVSPSTVKRWLAGNNLTIDRLEALCDLAAISLSELVERADDVAPGKILRLSQSQERGLAEDTRLAFLFFSILNGWPPADFAREFGIGPELMQAYLDRLHRLGLVDILPSGRVRSRAARRVTWRRGGPLARHFEAKVKHHFMGADFGDSSTFFLSDIVKVSPAGAAQIEALVEQFRKEIHRIAEIDARAAAVDGRWRGVLFAVREIPPASVDTTMTKGSLDGP
jgi:transcriptional regulator with XRE-family HTH domain